MISCTKFYFEKDVTLEIMKKAGVALVRTISSFKLKFPIFQISTSVPPHLAKMAPRVLIWLEVTAATALLDGLDQLARVYNLIRNNTCTYSVDGSFLG